MALDAGKGSIRVAIVDDHPVVRRGLADMLSEFPDMEIVGVAEGGRQGLECIELTRPCVVLLDLELPDTHGLEVLAQATMRFPEVRVVVLTIHDESEIANQAIRGGAAGYVLKDAGQEELVSAIRIVAHGGEYFASGIVKTVLSQAGTDVEKDSGLTAREMGILRLLAEGLSNRGIGETLCLSPETVKSHVSSIYRKLAVSDRAQAVSVALRTRLID